jgi:hypothetical protein
LTPSYGAKRKRKNFFGGILKTRNTKVGVGAARVLKFHKVKSKENGSKTDLKVRKQARGKIRDRVSSSWAKTTRYCSLPIADSHYTRPTGHLDPQ